jgi:hypothetical protein
VFTVAVVSTVGRCHYPQCCNLHFCKSVYCREHNTGDSAQPGALAVNGTMVATPAMAGTRRIAASANFDNFTSTADLLTTINETASADVGFSQSSSLSPARNNRSLSRTMSTVRPVPSSAPAQELGVLSVTQGDAAMQYHLQRLSLREKAQELANIKCEDIDVSQEVIDEALELARASSLALYQFDNIELGHLLMQFKQLDVNCDGKITPQDIRSLVLRVDREWATSDDPILQQLLEASCCQWLRTASPDGAEEMSFVGYVKALMQKRSDEADNYGYPTSTIIPSELLQHPFWDLRTLLCTTSSTELSGWILKRGYTFPKSSFNSWKLRYFRLVLEDGHPLLEYWDDYQPSEMINEDSLSLSFPAITRCHSSLTGSRTREAAAAQSLREQTQAESAVVAALAAVDAGARLDRANTQTNLNNNGAFHFQGILNAHQINTQQSATLKGTIALRDVLLFDFSPKTEVTLSSSVTESLKSNQVNMTALTVIKIIMRNGRTYTLACGEDSALNWMAELIRFTNRFHAEADWRRNWGMERQMDVGLRDWLNASSVNLCTVVHYNIYDCLASVTVGRNKVGCIL